MASFDVFRSVGPQVDVSLFGDAAAQGVRLGEALPSPITSAIEGGFKGYEEGQKIRGAAAQIENEEAIAEINKNKAAISTLDQSTQIAIAQQESQNQLQQAQQVNQDFKAKQAISEKLASSDPQVRASVLNDPALKQVIIKDPGLSDSIAGQLNNNPYAPKDVLAQLQGVAGLYKQQKFNLEQERAFAVQDASILKDYQKYYDAAHSGGVASLLVQGIPENELPSRVKVYPKGTIATDENGVIVQDSTPDLSRVNDEKNKGFSSVYIDNKYAGDVLDNDGKGLANWQNAITSKQRMLARSSGLYYPGWQYQPPSQPTTQTFKADPNKVQSELPTFQSATTVPDKVPTNPNINQTIVDQSQQAFNQQLSNPPQGLTRNQLEARRQKAKQYANSIAGPTPSVPLNQSNNQTVKTNTEYSANAAPKLQSDVAINTTPQRLNSMFGMPVSLNVTPPAPINPSVYEAVNTNPLTANEAPLVKGLVAVESGGKTKATSPTGVVGLAQVTRATAESFGLNRDIPEEGLLAGKLYLAKMVNTFGGNLKLGLAAYNTGPGVIQEAIRQTGVADWEIVRDYLKETLNAKKFKEVDTYPDRVLAYTAHFMGNGHDSDQATAYLYQQNGLITPQQTGSKITPADTEI